MSEQNADSADKRIITQLRVETELWTRVKRQASRRRMSANAYACNALEAAVRADERTAEEQ